MAIAVAAISVMIVAVFAGLSSGLFTGSSNPAPEPISTTTNGTGLVGVKVGDIFTYKLTGSSVLGSPDVVTPEELSQYNDTDYYQVTVTGVGSSTVMLETMWRFTNGTVVNGYQTIDLSNGRETDPNGFWGVYASNISVKDLLHPAGSDGLTVNKTEIIAFANSNRVTNYWSTYSQYIDKSDPTGNTFRNEFVGVYFDKQTGMLYNSTHIEFYTDPMIQLVITWQLTSSTAWAI